MTSTAAPQVFDTMPHPESPCLGSIGSGSGDPHVFDEMQTPSYGYRNINHSISSVARTMDCMVCAAATEVQWNQSNNEEYAGHDLLMIDASSYSEYETSGMSWSNCPTLQGKVLSVVMHQVKHSVSIDVLNHLFSLYGVVEKIFQSLNQHDRKVLIQYQHDYMAENALRATHGWYLYHTYCQLDIRRAYPAELQMLYDYSCAFLSEINTSEQKLAHEAETPMVDASDNPYAVTSHLKGHISEQQPHVIQAESQCSCSQEWNTNFSEQLLEEMAQRHDLPSLEVKPALGSELQDLCPSPCIDYVSGGEKNFREHHATATTLLGMHVQDPQLPAAVKDSNMFDTMPVYDDEVSDYLNGFLDVLDANLEQQQDEEGKPYMEQTSKCCNKKSENALLEVPTGFAFSDHALDFLARSSKLTNEKNTLSDSMPVYDVYDDKDSACCDENAMIELQKFQDGDKLSRTKSDWEMLVMRFSQTSEKAINEKVADFTFTNSSGSMYISDVVVTASGTRDMPITDFQAFHDGENLLLGKSDSELLHKSFNFTLAHAPYFRSLYVPDVHVGKVQHTKAYKWSMLLPEEGRKDWDPGASVNLLLFTSMNTYYYSSLSCNQKQISKLCSALQALMCDATAPEDKIFGDPYTSVENDYKLKLAQTIVPSHNSRTATIAVIRSQDYSFQWEARLQWDPGANMAYFYSWLQIFSEFEKPLQLTQDFTAWPNQPVGSGASYIWDPGTMLLQYKLLFTEEKEMVTLIPEQWSFRFNAMHYCQIFEKCINGIALWLIHFQPP